MPASIRIRPLIARWRGWLPLAVLLVALSSVFVLGGDRGYFYRWYSIHNQISAKNLAIAGNISPKIGFRLARVVWKDEDSGLKPGIYGRFPVGGYALIKLAMIPFGSDLAAKLLAARVLMLLMFCGAAVFAYLALARIAGNRWIALAAALFAFSSLYPLYYADAVAGETAMDLFGAALVFHGMVVFAQEGRFRQLLVKTCAALFLGWHVYALIMPFALWGFGGEALALVRANAGSSGGGGGGRIRAALAALPALARSRFAALAAAAILFGSALLAINLANEYAAHGGNRSLLDLPSVGSMMKRLGATDAYEDNPDAEWGNFLLRQFHRAGVSVAPYAGEWFSGRDFPSPESESPSPARAALGGAATVAALAALALVPRRFRAPIAAAALMGFCWALAARGNTFAEYHSHEGMFFVGLPLALWVGALIGARRLLGARLGGALAIGIAALAAPVFALSTLQAAQIRQDADAAKRAKEIMADMSAISEIASEKSVAIHADAIRKVNNHGLSSNFAMNYYLAGSYRWHGASGRADYAVSLYRNESFNLLTPDNRHLFLYARADLGDIYRAERRRLESSQADAESFFDVYLAERGLAYLRSPCAWEDVPDDRPFFLILYPVGANGPSEHRYLRFPFSRHGAVFDDACMMVAELPDGYPAASMRTGQYTPEGDRLWEAAIVPPPSAETLAAYERVYQAIADGEPAAQSAFDIYLDADGGAISYLKRPCSEEDARGRFFLSVHPADAADLPAERREIGHESLNFDFFPPHGAVFNGKCMATVQLPDYEIAKMETGQDAPDGRLWEAAVVPPSAYETAYQEIASRELSARSGFDLYLDADADTLAYLKQPCTEDDARGRFWLSVHPANAADLPAERREIGHESLNFDFFPPHGAVFNGKCMATVQLPDYEIAKMETGQDAPDGRLWEAAVVPPSAYESAYQEIASRELSARSGFDLYLDADADTLAYLKQPCSEDDARGRFWLSVHPANAADLPAERREIGHESLNFDFFPPFGVVFNGKCMATIQLPDYEIAKIETGQDVDGGRLWDAALDIGD